MAHTAYVALLGSGAASVRPIVGSNLIDAEPVAMGIHRWRDALVGWGSLTYLLCECCWC